MKESKINLESFMAETFQLSGMSFDVFHKMFRYVNERHFGRTLYQQIKNNEISALEVADRLKRAM